MKTLLVVLLYVWVAACSFVGAWTICDRVADHWRVVPVEFVLPHAKEAPRWDV